MDTQESTKEPREKPSPNLGLRTASIFAILSVLCVVYVLSIGPFMAVMAWTGVRHNDPGEACFMTIYAPLLELSHNTPIGPPLERYTDWWMDMGRRLADR